MVSFDLTKKAPRRTGKNFGAPLPFNLNGSQRYEKVLLSYYNGSDESFKVSLGLFFRARARARLRYMENYLNKRQ